MLHEDITGRIIDAAMKVHTALGAGLLESTYQTCLHYQFSIDGLRFEHQVRLLIPLHTAQLLSYLKLSGRQVGLLINFNVPHLRQGVKRVVNGFGARSENHLPTVSPVSTMEESLNKNDRSGED